MVLPTEFLQACQTCQHLLLNVKIYLSTKKYPDDASRVIESELQNDFIVGPFKESPFRMHRISPIGIAEGTYSKKKRLIIDL